MRDTIINDLLDSVKRLNEELASRIDFEHALMDEIHRGKVTIEMKDEEIRKRNVQISDLEDTILSKENDIYNLTNEGTALKDLLEKKYLTDEEELLWHSDTKELMIHNTKTGEFESCFPKVEDEEEYDDPYMG